MAGFDSITGLEDVVYADNVSFDGTQRGGMITTDGELLIGSTAAPHIRKGTITAGANITVTNGEGSIEIASTGGGGATPPKEYWFSAESLQPLETNFAPLEKLSGTTVKTFVRAFDDTTEE